MIRTWALFAVLISGALIDVARGSDLVECEPQRVTDDGPPLGPPYYRWSRVLVPGTAREAKERAVLGSRDHPFRAPDGGPARARDRDRALRAALPPRGCATGETADRRGNAGGMARDWRRPVARVHLLLAGVGAARPAAGLAAGLATARALPAVVDCQAKTRVTGSSCRRCWPTSRARPHPPASPQRPR